jgi:hypothetical protein
MGFAAESSTQLIRVCTLAWPMFVPLASVRGVHGVQLRACVCHTPELSPITASKPTGQSNDITSRLELAERYPNELVN